MAAADVPSWIRYDSEYDNERDAVLEPDHEFTSPYPRHVIQQHNVKLAYPLGALDLGINAASVGWTHNA